MAKILDKIMHGVDEYDFPEWFSPETAGTQWQVLTKGSGDDYDWSNLPAETVVSGDTWTTYTIKVSNSDPASWTPATTITFVS